jgi:hypothetical protein
MADDITVDSYDPHLNIPLPRPPAKLSQQPPSSASHAAQAPRVSSHPSGQPSPTLLDSSSSTLEKAAKRAVKLPPKQLSKNLLESIVTLSARANADMDGKITEPDSFVTTLSALHIFESVKEYIKQAPAAAAAAAEDAAKEAEAALAATPANIAKDKRVQEAKDAKDKAEALNKALTKAIQVAAAVEPTDLDGKAAADAAVEAARAAADNAWDASDNALDAAYVAADANAAAAGRLRLPLPAKDYKVHPNYKQPVNIEDNLALFGPAKGNAATQLKKRAAAKEKEQARAAAAAAAAADGNDDGNDDD